MILKASQRGHGRKLAQHLLNYIENDFVEVHQVSGFLSDDVTGAFREVENIAKGTRCKQPFFSVALNPPADAGATVAMFEAAADRIAKEIGLTDQPRVLVFHEKEGRRHAHLVISRIDAESMTAINLPHFKNRLKTLSCDLFLEHGWKLPDGLRDRTQKSPTNVTLAEWQAAKRRGKNALDQKKLIQQCLAASDGQAGFEAALSEHGYILAKGNRRSHVVVCHDGEVLAVARATGLKAKKVRELLGEADSLPSVDQAMAQHANDVRRQFVRMAGEAKQQTTDRRRRLKAERKALIGRQTQERVAMDKGQSARWKRESELRASRFGTGIKGLWQRLSGQRQKVIERNEQEAYEALQRDRAQRQRLIEAQLKERQQIDQQRVQLRQEAFGLIDEMRNDRDRLITKLSEPPMISARPKRQSRQNQPWDRGPDFDLDIQ
ncbi:MAG: relaxase/mobilization nuclease domain-containing protein [Nisaea sp.]|uniref:relaxase/mobilization nuclease domain-containing protein n=1 Tax=Nisaea sp. TaxID=2024842 RepID=UPI0032996247